MAKIGSNKIIISRSRVWLVVLLVVGFGIAIGRLFYFSCIIGEELQQKAYSQQLNDTTISAKRGSIYDTTGKTLAQSATVPLSFAFSTGSRCMGSPFRNNVLFVKF